VKDLEDGNILKAIRDAGTAYNTTKNSNVKSNFKQEIKGMLAPSRGGFGSPISTNRNILFDIPDRSVTPYFIGTAGAPTISNPPTPGPVTTTPTAGTQVRK
jgi:hypothetical protein